MTIYIIAGIVLIALSAFFSASEMALSSSNRLRLENMAEDGSRAAKSAVRVLDRFDDALSAILIGNNFVNIALSSIGSAAVITLFGEKYTWIATVIVTVLVIIFGETVPKIAAKKNANRMSLAVAGIIRVLSFILKPVIFIVVGLVHLITAPMKGEDNTSDAEDAVEELQSIIETAEDEDVLDEDRSELLQAALDFDEISASEVMTARVDIVAVDIDDSKDEIFEAACSSNYSRIPVYDGSIDNVVGILFLNHYFKALAEETEPDVRTIMMKPCYIYKTTKLPIVLETLKKAKCHLAVVTDEYGGTLGIITMEDVLEQLVGEIWDETDEIEAEVVLKSEGEYELDGDMAIGDFFDLVGIGSDEEDETESATVGGWTLEKFGSYPAEGESFTCGGVTVTVLKTDGLRVEKVMVKVIGEHKE